VANDRYFLAGVGRALQFLEVIADHETGLTLKQATDLAEVDPTGAFRIAHTLEHEGYLIRDEHGLYKLGPTVLRLGVTYLNSLNLRKTALPRLGALIEWPADSASLATLSGRRAVVIERLERQPSEAGTRHVGWSFSLHSTSLGKTLLAYLPDATIREWLESMPLQRFSGTTIVDPQVLMAELEQIRTQGYAFNFEESGDGALAVAAPVRNHLGEIIGALNVSGQMPTMTKEYLQDETLKSVVSAADALSRDLGYRSDQVA